MITGDWSRGQWRVIGLFNREHEQRNDTPILNLFNPQRIPEARQAAGLLSLQSDFAMAARFNLHLQFDWLRSHNKIYDPLLKDDFHLYYDSTANAARGVEWTNAFRGPGQFSYFAFPFSRPGDVRAKYSKAEENYRSFSGHLQKQFGQHWLKLGAAWERRTLRNFAIGYPQGFAEANRSYQQQAGFASLTYIRNWGRVQNYGYDLFGKRIEQADEISDGPAHPSSFAVYLEESLRTSNLLLTAGIRYDAFASDGRVFINPTDPALQNYFTDLPLRTMKKAPTHRYVTPRFSAAFMANERLTLKFDYGKYVQAPQLRDVYASRQERVEFLRNYSINYTPRALDAEAIRSTQATTEIIFQPNAFVRVQTALFHKQISGQLHAQKITTLREPDREAYYLVLGNDGEAKTQGLEVALNWSRKNWQAWLNYTFASARGLTSYPNENLRSLYLFGQFTTPHQFTPLEFDQKHRGNFLLSYQFDRAAPAWLRHTGLHALAQFNNGHPYTLREPGDAFG
jgi:outer membrane receptor for ferrienterochelin and colicin